jgi:DNA polymerase-3 subunit alpha
VIGLSYLGHKYGSGNVAQIITFQRMQGRAALKDIFRIKNVEGGFDLSNEICTHIPAEAEIADQIQERREAGDENYGILQWALEHNEDILKYYNNEEFKPLFDQAVRCEGVKRGSGKHPSGIIVTS